MKKCTIEISENDAIDMQTNGLPTMSIINALDAIIRVLCRDIVGEEKEDSEKLANQMRDHFLHGRYEIKKANKK